MLWAVTIIYLTSLIITLKPETVMKKNLSKFLFLLLTFELFFLSNSPAQNGLECVLVEKYYISDANDTIANPDGGVLPVGSVTYRIYADMLPGYRFQAVYGVNTPGAEHECRIETSTLFFNNEDRGAATPNFTKAQAADNTVMLDSWLSVGAACKFNYGILKSLDDGVATVSNTYLPPVLQNNHPDAGIPLTVQDGIIAGNATPEPVTFVGITTEVLVFDNQNDGTNGPLFLTDNGSWAALNGAVGPDSIDNKVLIAQITTDGIFKFELNIQIGAPLGGVENYVAKNPVGSEIMLPCLTFDSSTDINEQNSGSASLSVYPNPVKSIFTLEILPHKSARTGYMIFDKEGRLIMKKNLGTISVKFLEYVDLTGFANGVYLVELYNDSYATSMKKIVKN